MKHNLRMKGDDIAVRLVRSAARVTKVVDALPQSATGKHMAGQLLRSGTTPGAHYEEGRGAESRRDFIHKLGVGLKELQETRYWLQVICEAALLPQDRLSSLINEIDQLCKIIGQSILTSRSSPRPGNGQRR